jgi:UDP-GlcNAc:undecaprenyl-phosphate GlcNAc-1-phosphate transferase
MIPLLAQITPEEALSGGTDDLLAREPFVADIMGLLNNYATLFVVAFGVTLLATPLVRRAAIAAGIVDRPDFQRKQHRAPVPYLGGVAVFLGVMAAIAVSFFALGGAQAEYRPIPISIIIGIVAITFAGLADDVWGWDPRLKIAGQLVAAAALAVEDVGVRVAEGMLRPIFGAPEQLLFGAEWLPTNAQVYYWVGTAIIATFVLGGCNAANLIDGLDGLLSGTIAIVALGLLAISLVMAVAIAPVDGEESLAGARVALSLAVLGAVLGFLPHNFNPASIFLGDSGSLLLGYLSVVIILMLGDQGHTPLVFAGLIVFSVPIMDTTLAIVRRKMSGRPMSAADNQHIHHQLLRALGGVKRAVFALYGISAAFALLGVTLAVLVMQTDLRVRVIYAIALVLFGFIGVMAFKAGRQRELDAQMDRLNGHRAGEPAARVDSSAAQRSIVGAEKESESLV